METVLFERVKGIEEELGEVVSMAELDAITTHWDAEAPEVLQHGGIMALVDVAKHRLQAVPVTDEHEVPMDVAGLEAQINALMAQLQGLKPQAAAPAQPPVQRAGRKYKLLSTDVSWPTKPQVQALMQI